MSWKITHDKISVKKNKAHVARTENYLCKCIYVSTEKRPEKYTSIC